MSAAGDLGERHRELLCEVEQLLRQVELGETRLIKETQNVDFKEEAGRRNRDGSLQPGETTNTTAAAKLANEVACQANTPRGGALILGVDDKTLQVLGTELDAGWLRQRIYSAVDIAPFIEERHLNGQRLLVLYVAESSEPVPDTGGNLRWRVNDNCMPVDRTEWWLKREEAGGFDIMARKSNATLDEVSPAAMKIARRYLFAGMQSELPEDSTDTAVLQAIGALRPQHALTRAARLLFCPAQRSLLTLTVFDVPGGNVVNFFQADPETSLIEQLSAIEQRIDAINHSTVVPSGFSENKVRNVPPRAVREAILNGLIHRDWNTSEPTEVVWIDFDATLSVKSPGGFTGEVNADNLLTSRHSRYPALADLFRALKLVDKQGVGVDRMYQSMITLGHLPPIFKQVAGPAVSCTLVGGKPVIPMMELVNRIEPPPRRSDVRIAIILNELLHEPFTTREQLARRLQTDQLSTDVALRAAASSTISAKPLIQEYKNAWILSDEAYAAANKARKDFHASEFLNYAGHDRQTAARVTAKWLEHHGSITSGDLIQLIRVSRPTALSILNELTGSLLEKTGAGRTTQFVRASTARS